MLPKIGYIASHYFFLFLFIFSTWGSGRAVLRRVRTAAQQTEGLMEHALSITLGMAFTICALQWLAIIGMLRTPWVVGVLIIGFVAGVMQLTSLSAPAFRLALQRWQTMSFHERCCLSAVLLCVVATLLAPLGPPLEWDELMYHLPHARQWAMSGHLDVNEWLRYPWFPYNYELLYSAALILTDDVIPHMLHALAGWLVAIMVYQLGKRYCDYWVACLGAVIWLVLSRSQFDNAYIDMGVTLYVFSACITFRFWQEEHQLRWLAISAFFMGVAVGCKYQALSFLPIFAVAVLLQDRKPRTIVVATICLLIPCLYWYARNAFHTGDPFNPIGGKIFGFTDWNLGDYQGQFSDLKRHAGWPSFLIWPAILAPFISRLRATPAVRSAMCFCAYCLFVWSLTSHYPRYLMPVYPLLALLAGCGWQWLFMRLPVTISLREKQLVQNACWFITFTLLIMAVSFSAPKSWRRIASDSETREAILEKNVSGYKVLSYLRQHSVGKIYQFGLEDAVYYAPNPIWGDYFGPARYRDFATLPPGQLAQKLAGLGFKELVIHTKRWPDIDSRPNFDRYFAKVYEADSVTLYRIGTATQ
jgi:hypothetical protein